MTGKPIVPYWHLWNDRNGISRQKRCMITDFELKSISGKADPQWQAPKTKGSMTEMVTVLPVGWIGSWHENPKPQWILPLSGRRLQLTAGPDRLLLDAKVSLRGEDFRTVGEFDVSAGEEVGFTLRWTPSFHTLPAALTARDALAQVESFWTHWSAGFKPIGDWSDAVLRSLQIITSFKSGSSRQKSYSSG